MRAPDDVARVRRKNINAIPMAFDGCEYPVNIKKGKDKIIDAEPPQDSAIGIGEVQEDEDRHSNQKESKAGGRQISPQREPLELGCLPISHEGDHRVQYRIGRSRAPVFANLVNLILLIGDSLTFGDALEAAGALPRDATTAALKLKRRQLLGAEEEPQQLLAGPRAVDKA